MALSPARRIKICIITYNVFFCHYLMKYKLVDCFNLLNSVKAIPSTWSMILVKSGKVKGEKVV